MHDTPDKKLVSTTPLISHKSDSPTSSSSSPEFTKHGPALTYETLSTWLLSSSRPPPELGLTPPPRFGKTDPATPTDPPRSQATALQHAAHLISEVYTHIVKAGCWDSAFPRGDRPSPRTFQIGRSALGICGGPPVRRLASMYIGLPGTDSWNVIVAATELARKWALPRATPPLEPTEVMFLLDRATRMRIAVALATAWHFQRSSATRFPREYASDLSQVEGATGDFSFELARIGYLSLYDSERRRLGPWPIDMVVEMQACLLDLQIGLLIGTPTFGPMVRNAQVVAEERLFELIEDSRSLLTISGSADRTSRDPFFVRNLWLSNSGRLYVQIFDDTPELPVRTLRQRSSARHGLLFRSRPMRRQSTSARSLIYWSSALRWLSSARWRHYRTPSTHTSIASPRLPFTPHPTCRTARSTRHASGWRRRFGRTKACGVCSQRGCDNKKLFTRASSDP